MKLVLFACLAAVALAAPQLPVVQVLRQEQVDNDGTGVFRYILEADNGIYVAASGIPGSQGQVNHEGSYSLPTADGGYEQVSYVANENGFQPQSSLLPQDHPLPAYVVELLASVDELVRQGATWDEQGRRLTR